MGASGGGGRSWTASQAAHGEEKEPESLSPCALLGVLETSVPAAELLGACHVCIPQGPAGACGTVTPSIPLPPSFPGASGTGLG